MIFLNFIFRILFFQISCTVAYSTHETPAITSRLWPAYTYVKVNFQESHFQKKTFSLLESLCKIAEFIHNAHYYVLSSLSSEECQKAA